MQDPTGSDTAARRALKEIASAVRQRAVEIDDRPTTELGLRPRRQHLYRRDGWMPAFCRIVKSGRGVPPHAVRTQPLFPARCVERSGGRDVRFCAGAAGAGAAGAVPVLSEPEPGGQPGAAACGAGGRGAAFVGPRPAGGGGRAARRQRGPVAHAGAVCGGAGGAAGGGALRLVQDGLGHRQCLHHGRGTGPWTGPHRSGLFPPVPQQRAPDHPAGRPHVGGRQAGARGAVCGAALPGRGAFEPDGIFHGCAAPSASPQAAGQGDLPRRSPSSGRPVAVCALPLHRYVGRAVSRAGRSTRG